jgi:hypothetical protein
MAEMWRDDTNSKEEPAGQWVVIHARDVVKVNGMFTLHVLHVNSIDGKGFKTHISTVGAESVYSSSFHLGTDETTYAAAKAEGEELLKLAMKDGE